GVLGFVVTIWQWRASGFRPRLTAYVDAPRAAIEVDIENRGRGPGFVHHVAVVDPRGLETKVRIEGYEKGFEATYLPGEATMRLSVLPEEFREEQQVFVDLGRRRRFLVPEPVAVALFRMKTVRPHAP